MELQKINVKFFLAGARGVRLEPLIEVFNGWIQSSDGAFYDLADYRHVEEGPGLLLIADEANIGVDNTGGRPGLLYQRKRPLEGANEDRLLSVLAAALGYCRRLEREPALDGKLRFLGNEAWIGVNDRLIAPNTEATYSALLPDFEALGRRLYGDGAFRVERAGEDPRERFAVTLKSALVQEVETLKSKLNGAAG